MAFDLKDLSVLAYASGFTLWVWKAHGTPRNKILEPGFFNGAGHMLAAQDMMLVSGTNAALIGVVDEDGGVLQLKELT